MFVRKFADWIQFANGTKCSRTGQNVHERDKMFANGQRSRMGRNIYIKHLSPIYGYMCDKRKVRINKIRRPRY